MADIHSVAERFFCASERQRLRQADVKALCAGFFTCWVRKEAYIKALGTGLSTPLDRFSVTLLADESPAILEIDGSRNEASDWELRHLEPAPGYVGAIAIEGCSIGVSGWISVSVELLESS